jgi:protein-disulfide isomerase
VSRAAAPLTAALLLLAAGGAEAQPRTDALAPRVQAVRVVHDASLTPTLGPRHAPVTAELFFNPASSSVRATWYHLRELARVHPRRLRVVFRPLPAQGQALVPEAVLEAHAQGKFAELLDELYAHGGSIRREQLEAAAAEVDLDMERVEAAWDDGRHQAALQANARAQFVMGARTSGPDLLFNGIAVPRRLASMTIDELEQAYDDAYARALVLLDDDVPVAQIYDELLRAKAEAEPLPVVRLGPVDELAALDGADTTPHLLPGALATDGLRGSGPALAPVQIVLLCNLASMNCAKQASRAGEAAALFGDDVHLVVYPFYRVPEEADVAERLHRLHEAWLCADEQGGYVRYFEESVAFVTRQLGRPVEADKQIEQVAANAGLDAEKLGACLTEGRQAKALDDRLFAARLAGVPVGPAIILGGRLYLGGVSSKLLLQKLIAVELTPSLGDRLLPADFE